MAEATSTELNASAATEAPETVTTGRALVPLTQTAAEVTPLRRSVRADATFVVHLIATAAHAPQTRNLRRAETGDAMTSYRGTITRERATTAVPSGLSFSRVA